MKWLIIGDLNVVKKIIIGYLLCLIFVTLFVSEIFGLLICVLMVNKTVNYIFYKDQLDDTKTFYRILSEKKSTYIIERYLLIVILYVFSSAVLFICRSVSVPYFLESSIYRIDFFWNVFSLYMFVSMMLMLVSCFAHILYDYFNSKKILNSIYLGMFAFSMIMPSFLLKGPFSGAVIAFLKSPIFLILCTLMVVLGFIVSFLVLNVLYAKKEC